MIKRNMRINSGLSPPPNIDSRLSSSKSKTRILSKFQEDEIFGEQEIDLEDEFKTLKLLDLQQLQLRKNLKAIKDYGDDFEDFQPDNFNIKIPPPDTNDMRLSPGTISNSSRKKSLSEYSEDTDVTSEMNEDDFEDVENIFGDQIDDNIETSRVHDVLKNKKLKMKHEADKEEQELMKKYKHDEFVTLKLKNFSVDHLDNEKTINYEFTRDEFEDFEDGFENINKLSFKKSMPTFNSRSKLEMKKFQSSYNLNQQTAPKYNNRVMSKLDRIPSFANQKMLNEMMEKNKNFKLTKQQLLQQYEEIDKQHKRTNEKILNLKKSMSMPARRVKGKKIGLVRYLGDVPNVENSNMRFNKESKNWEGNEIELMKFNTISKKKPSLIKFNDYNTKNDTNVAGDMVFDPVNLKWVSQTPEEDVFKELSDFHEPDNKSRGVSNFTARTLSTNNEESENVYIVSKKLIDRFLKEEVKLSRRVENWFDHQQVYELNNEIKTDYYWDIRKLVMDNE